MQLIQYFPVSFDKLETLQRKIKTIIQMRISFIEKMIEERIIIC